MFLGYLKYPATYFVPEDIENLANNPFLTTTEPAGGNFNCEDLDRGV